MKQKILCVAVSLVAGILTTEAVPVTTAAPQRQAIVVTSTADPGPGTLREALDQASAGTTITFDPTIFPPDNPATITVISALPELTQGQVTIDASNAGVILDGSQLPRGEVIYGLLVTSDENAIRGLQILRFPGDGISIVRGAQHNTIGGDRTVGAGPTGQGNVISGNGEQGITIGDPETSHNVVTGNYIGIDPSGSFALGNGTHGIMIQRSADNAIGGNSTGERNIISGNGAAGVRIEYPESTGNIVIGNYIGLEASGSRALGGNDHAGVSIGWGASENRIGGFGEEERNIISGNVGDGVYIEGQETALNLVLGNFIGLDLSGTRPLPNSHGISIRQGANHTVVQGNVISGHEQNPNVVLWDSGTSFNVLIVNFIGTDASGTVAIGGGIGIRGGASHNRIGGSEPGERNLISGSKGSGIDISWGSAHNEIVGNFIGTDITGSFAVPNAMGVLITDAPDNKIGGTAEGEGNIISGSEVDGVVIVGAESVGNEILGNYVGISATGTEPIGNGAAGVWVGEGAQYNIIGGSTPGERNVISGNGDNGAVIDGATHNTISGNYIGTDVTGAAAVGNGNIGVVLAWGAQHNVVGGATPEERNLISGNSNVGVSIANSDTMSNTISGNYIGTDVTGTEALSNSGAGIWIGDGARYNVIGGAMPEERNLISGNGGNGVNIGDNDTMWNVLTGNYIGTDFSGTVALGNVGYGVLVDNGAGPNTIGPGNIISYNHVDGVRVNGSGTLGNALTGNSIYDNQGLGMRNSEGGNAALPAPTISYASSRVVKGTAPPNSTVEVFFDEENEGRLHYGDALADGEGNFTFIMPVGRFTEPNVTATAQDGDGNTSQFSSPQAPRTPVVTRELPGIVGPTQVSVEPTVVGTNLGLALFSVLFFGLTSSAFNTILRDYRDELLATLGRFAPRALVRGLAKVGPSLGHLTKRGRGSLVLTWLLVLLLTSLIESFLDPQLGVLTAERLGLLITLFVSGVAASGLELGSDLYAHRRWAPTIKTEGKVQWVGIAIAAACVILSRALDFKPGYLYGIVGAIYVMPRLSGVRKSGKSALLVLLTVFAGGLILWLATAFLPPALTEIEPLFLTVFVIILEGVFFALIPLAFTDGGHIWDWCKSVWFVFFAVVFFGFYHFLLNPNASDVRALQQNGVQTVLMLTVVFGFATIILWMLFPLRLRGKRARRS